MALRRNGLFFSFFPRGRFMFLPLPLLNQTHLKSLFRQTSCGFYFFFLLYFSPFPFEVATSPHVTFPNNAENKNNQHTPAVMETKTVTLLESTDRRWYLPPVRLHWTYCAPGGFSRSDRVLLNGAAMGVFVLEFQMPANAGHRQTHLGGGSGGMLL